MCMLCYFVSLSADAFGKINRKNILPEMQSDFKNISPKTACAHLY